MIVGETGDSGHGLGFGEIAKPRGLPTFWEGFEGCHRGDLSDPRSGLIMGDSNCESRFVKGALREK